MCENHNHEMTKLLVGHPYVGRLTKDEKIITVDMTKSMVKPRNILLTLKEHNANNYTTIKQIYNARNVYRSFIRDSNTEMQQLIKLLKRDQYIHWHRLKDEDVVRDIFWCTLMQSSYAMHVIWCFDTKQTSTVSHYMTLLV